MSDINTIKEHARTFEGLIPPNSAKLVYKEEKAGDTYFYFMDDDGNYYFNTESQIRFEREMQDLKKKRRQKKRAG
jgi:hypothetical protein|nr:MAG TPA: hypothetical protein [Caudoviricetes sp.]